MSFKARDASIYRPYPDEAPWPAADLEWTRVAKLDGEVIGAYEIKRIAATRFEVVAVWVDEAYRRRGLGAWLLGHAIGLSESKGAREIDARARGATADRFYGRHRFEAAGDTLRLKLTRE